MCFSIAREIASFLNIGSIETLIRTQTKEQTVFVDVQLSVTLPGRFLQPPRFCLLILEADD